MNRRNFLGTAIAGAIGFTASDGKAHAAEQKSTHQNRFALATYSIWRFKDGLKK